MNRKLNKGDKIHYKRMVVEDDVAAFHGEVVHSVYSTFAMARDAEYCTRQFILSIIQEGEEGIGTSLVINHLNSAFVGDLVIFTGEVLSFEHGRLLCKWKAQVDGRLIAEGKTGQKLLKKEALARLFKKRIKNG